MQVLYQLSYIHCTRAAQQAELSPGIQSKAINLIIMYAYEKQLITMPKSPTHCWLMFAFLYTRNSMSITDIHVHVHIHNVPTVSERCC